MMLAGQVLADSWLTDELMLSVTRQWLVVSGPNDQIKLHLIGLFLLTCSK